jgi:hypothetical protein
MVVPYFVVDVLVLEDLSYGYHRPSILDLKIGTRQHGPGAPAFKIASKTAKCSSTTSATLGLRMCGMQVLTHLSAAAIDNNNVCHVTSMMICIGIPSPIGSLCCQR